MENAVASYRFHPAAFVSGLILPVLLIALMQTGLQTPLVLGIGLISFLLLRSLIFSIGGVTHE